MHEPWSSLHARRITPWRWVGWTGSGFLLATLLLAPACSVASPQLRDPHHVPSPDEPGPLKVHLHSGDLVVLTSWEEDVLGRRITGIGTRHDPDRNPRSPPGPTAVSVDSVALLEIRRRTPDLKRGTGITLLATYTVLTGAVSIICLADPKACFGSCPTFYLDDPQGTERLAAEGFSSSVARALEATDVDDLRVGAYPGPFSIRLRNEALETHAIRSLRLHAVPELEGNRVLATPEGEFRVALHMLEPVRCTGPEGDCLDRIRALDGVERASESDPSDLATREVIELEFDLPGPGTRRVEAGERRFGIALAARHSFVSTFLFYQMLSYLGEDAATLMASMERGDAETLERVRALKEMLGRLEVEWLGSDGSWHSAGAFVEAGPLATDLQLLELPELPDEGPLRVRLNLTQGFWRLEFVSLVGLGDIPASVVLSPRSVERLDAEGEGGAGIAPAPDALEALLDPSRHLVTEPGDHFRVEFELPAGPEDGGGQPPVYRLFLESTGYYYEWMRSEWMAEASPEKAARMFLRPDLAFRELAPVFKKLEPGMEEAFWNSRFRR